MVLGSNESFLNALDHLLALQLVVQVSLEHFLAMALPVEVEVDGRFDVVLVDHSQLVGHIALLVEEVLLWLSILHSRELIVRARHAQE